MSALETQFTLLGLGVNVSAEPAFPCWGAGRCHEVRSFSGKPLSEPLWGKCGHVQAGFYPGFIAVIPA